MNKLIYLLIVPLILSVCNCRKDTPHMWKKIQSQKTVSDISTDSLDRKNENLLTQLELLQNNLEKVNDTESKKTLVEKSFDTLSGCFFTAGKGVKNLSFPLEAQAASQKTAAVMNAKKWGLVIKAWSKSDFQIDIRKISGDIFYSRIVHEKSIGDTLFVLLQIPIGSIVLEKTAVIPDYQQNRQILN